MTTRAIKWGPGFVLLGFALVAFVLFPTSTMAATCLSVNVSTSSVAFGPYSPLESGPTESTGGITVSCPNSQETLPPITSITIDTGRSGSFTPRNMINATDGVTTLNYNFYTGADRLTIWGDGTSGTSFQTLPGGSASHTETFTIYGRIPGGQRGARAGSYSDPSISVVITY